MRRYVYTASIFTIYVYIIQFGFILFDLFTGPSSAMPTPQEFLHFYRPDAIYSHINVAALFIAAAALLAFDEKRYTLAGVFGVALLLSTSRTSMIALMLGAAVYLWLKGIRIMRFAPVVAVIGVAGVLVTFLRGGSSRMIYWSAGIDLLRPTPWLGVPRGAIRDLMAPLSQIHLHSLYVQMLVENGIVGLVLLIAAILIAFVLIWRYAPDRALAISMFTLFAGAGLFDYHFFSYPADLIFAGSLIAAWQSQPVRFYRADIPLHLFAAAISFIAFVPVERIAAFGIFWPMLHTVILPFSIKMRDQLKDSESESDQSDTGPQSGKNMTR